MAKPIIVQGYSKYSTSLKDYTLTKIDKICVEMKKQGKTYADWQKMRYPITVRGNTKGE